jgi:peptide deformylase
MALLPILEFPDPRLRTKAALIEAAQIATPAFQRLIDDMFETMYDAPGIGLAASQVDVHQRFMVIDVSERKMPRRCSSTRRSSPATAIRSIRKAACRCPASMPT